MQETQIFGVNFGRKPFCAWGVALTDLALTEFPNDWKLLQLLLCICWHTRTLFLPAIQPLIVLLKRWTAKKAFRIFKVGILWYLAAPAVHSGGIRRVSAQPSHAVYPIASLRATAWGSWAAGLPGLDSRLQTLLRLQRPKILRSLCLWPLRRFVAFRSWVGIMSDLSMAEWWIPHFPPVARLLQVITF